MLVISSAGTPMFSTMNVLVYSAIVTTQHWPSACSGPP